MISRWKSSRINYSITLDIRKRTFALAKGAVARSFGEHQEEGISSAVQIIRFVKRAFFVTEATSSESSLIWTKHGSGIGAQVIALCASLRQAFDDGT